MLFFLQKKDKYKDGRNLKILSIEGNVISLDEKIEDIIETNRLEISKG